MNGIIVIDKPADWTSHDVVAKLRGALKIKRIGHGGTLDPLATGVLPIFIGSATRAVEFCENADKEYIAGLRLGIVTDTQDITGNVLSSCTPAVSLDDISGIISGFLGTQMQIPPMYSAIKINGKKLYELARRGIEVERPPREITISAIELLEGSGNDYLLKIACSKGTYVRTICHDIGAALGCGGALSSLRRTRAGKFTIDMAQPLDEVLSAAASAELSKLILPIDTIFSDYPALHLTAAETGKCMNGAPCRLENTEDGAYRLYRPDNEFFIFGEVKGGLLKPIKKFLMTAQEVSGRRGF